MALLLYHSLVHPSDHSSVHNGLETGPGQVDVGNCIAYRICKFWKPIRSPPSSFALCYPSRHNDGCDMTVTEPVQFKLLLLLRSIEWSFVAVLLKAASGFLGENLKIIIIKNIQRLSAFSSLAVRFKFSISVPLVGQAKEEGDVGS